MTRPAIVALLGAGCLLVGCSSDAHESAVAPSSVSTAASIPPTSATAAVTLPDVPAATVAEPTTAPPAPPTSSEPTTTAPTTTVAPATTVAPTTIAATTTTIATTTPYGLPVPAGGPIGYAHEHHDYPASDVFAGGCGSPIIAPVNGVILEARRTDSWVASVDNPATRGGRSVTILGDDGVRYYLAHFQAITDGIEPGVRVTIGQSLGQMGMSGKAGACHVHFAISPPCPGQEWAVRRGVIWPWKYLDSWRKGEQLSPVGEIEQWVVDHPTACADAMADPNAADS
ncbi:MAG: Glycyl-glycine endopeptidase [Ilumatobacteraceae bacterium]|nr:Glycyl-glycine endopeptidase [Ilumatobacteraceae bacterium]